MDHYLFYVNGSGVYLYGETVSKLSLSCALYFSLLHLLGLWDGSLVLYFPALSYFPGNNTTYAGTFRGSEFVPIFKSQEARDYVFFFRGALKAIPVLGIDVENYAGAPLIGRT